MTSLRLFYIGAVLIIIPLVTSFWFLQSHVDWLIKKVEDPSYFLDTWQFWVSEQEGLKHPVVIHYLPDTCLCSALTQRHAVSLSETALKNGYTVHQIGSSKNGLGSPITGIGLGVPNDLSPLIIITQRNGDIRYLGAYSEGLLCNSSSSLVERFIEPMSGMVFEPPVIGIDVKSCHCSEK